MELTIHSLEELESFSKTFVKLLQPGFLVALEGDLGTGKTTFVKMCAKHLGIQDTVDSPTFTILKSYEDPLLHHIDAYRLEGASDIFEIEETLYDEDAYIFVEWASYIEKWLPLKRINIKFLVENKVRTLFITSQGGIDVESLFSH